MSKEDAMQKNIEGIELRREGKYEEALKLFSEAIEIDPEYLAGWLNRSETYRKLGREAEANADLERWEILKKKLHERDAEEALRRQNEGTPLREEGESPTTGEEEAEPIIPVEFGVEYDEHLSRWKLFFKWLFAIPLYLILFFYGIGATIVTFIAFWAILFTGRYPEGMFNFVKEYLERLFSAYAYFPLLMTDSWEGDDVFYSVWYPKRLSRLVLVFLKLPSFLLGIVSYLCGLVMCFLYALAIPVWFVILILGRYPRKLFNFSESLLNWVARVMTWQYLMRDNWSLFGTTKPVRILVIIGLVAALALSATSFTPLKTDTSPLGMWLSVIWYDEQDTAVSHYNQGTVLSSQGRFVEAVGEYTKAIEIDPEFAEAYCDRAVSYNMIGYIEKAIADGEKAIQLDPDMAEAYFTLGTAYLEKGNVGKAIIYFDKIIELEPYRALGYLGRGEAYLWNGDFDNAIADFDKAIELANVQELELGQAYLFRGLTYHEKGEMTKAVSDLEKFIELSNDPRSEIYYNPGIDELRGAVELLLDEIK